MHYNFQCKKCKRRRGWFGKLKDIPPCPYCGYKPDAKELDDDEFYLKEFQEYLRKKKNASS